MSDLLLDVKDLTMSFKVKTNGFFRKSQQISAVDRVSFQLRKGETLGLVGESGCGKSTLGRTVLRLYEPTGGTIRFKGHDISHLNTFKMRSHRREMQIVFQDPYSSLNPRMRVGEILAEPFLIHRLKLSPKEREGRISELLDTVGMPEEAKQRYPHEFSGGQRQRIGIARALALNPELVIADEPVSALDVSVQSQVLNLLVKLRKERGLSYLFIAHDLAVIEHISDRVAVMYLGRIVEMAKAEDLYQTPRHPYTKALLAAVPGGALTRDRKKREVLAGDVPSALNPPSGCHFHTRCPLATEECKTLAPELKHRGGTHDHVVACIKA